MCEAALNVTLKSLVRSTLPWPRELCRCLTNQQLVEEIWRKIRYEENLQCRWVLIMRPRRPNFRPNKLPRPPRRSRSNRLRDCTNIELVPSRRQKHILSRRSPRRKKEESLKLIVRIPRSRQRTVFEEPPRDKIQSEGILTWWCPQLMPRTPLGFPFDKPIARSIQPSLVATQTGNEPAPMSEVRYRVRRSPCSKRIFKRKLRGR